MVLFSITFHGSYCWRTTWFIDTCLRHGEMLPYIFVGCWGTWEVGRSCWGFGNLNFLLVPPPRLPPDPGSGMESMKQVLMELANGWARKEPWISLGLAQEAKDYLALSGWGKPSPWLLLSEKLFVCLFVFSPAGKMKMVLCWLFLTIL